jgi:hypothetical protein
MLERARSTSLALLGVTAAVGLATIAMVLRQEWPAVVGSPIPSAPSQQEAVGDATRAAGAKAAGGAVAHVRAASHPAAGSPRHLAQPRDGGAGSPAGSAPAEPNEFVVTPAAPVKRPGKGGSHRTPAREGPEPAAPSPQAVTVATPTTSPPSQSESQPESQPSPAPPATTSGAPPSESYVPEWSNGHGHAYGRADHDSGNHDSGNHDSGNHDSGDHDSGDR